MLAETETDALPFVRDAFRLHCARFPSIATGLNEVETATLASLERGSMRFGELFRAVTADPRGARHGMGDVQFAACVRGLVPLVSMSGSDVTAAEIAVTALGQEVLAGHRDWPSIRRSTSGSAAFTSRATDHAGGGTAPTASWSNRRGNA